LENKHKFEDTKWVIRSCKWKDRHIQWPKEEGQNYNNDPQNTTQKTKD